MKRPRLLLMIAELGENRNRDSLCTFPCAPSPQSMMPCHTCDFFWVTGEGREASHYQNLYWDSRFNWSKLLQFGPHLLPYSDAGIPESPRMKPLINYLAISCSFCCPSRGQQQSSIFILGTRTYQWHKVHHIIFCGMCMFYSHANTKSP